MSTFVNWCLNPKKILDRGKKFKSQFNNGAKTNVESCEGKGRNSSNGISGQTPTSRDSRETSSTDFSTTDEGNISFPYIIHRISKNITSIFQGSFRYIRKMSMFSFADEERTLECWICYDPDRTDVGPMINPCECRGDVSAVHHDCLQRWLMEVSIFYKLLGIKSA